MEGGKIRLKGVLGFDGEGRVEGEGRGLMGREGGGWITRPLPFF